MLLVAAELRHAYRCSIRQLFFADAAITFHAVSIHIFMPRRRFRLCAAIFAF